VSICDVCQTPLSDDNRVVWASGVRHHLRCPPRPKKARPAQRSLDAANKAKAARVALKGRLRQGDLELRDALVAAPLQGMRVFDLVSQLPLVRGRRGAASVERRVIALLDEAGVGLYREVGDLTDRQRGALAAGYAARPGDGGKKARSALRRITSVTRSGGQI
jgi:hypothetical protein